MRGREGLGNMVCHRILLTAALLILDTRSAAQKPYEEQITDHQYQVYGQVTDLSFFIRSPIPGIWPNSLWLYHDNVTWEEAFVSCQNMAASLAVRFTIGEMIAILEAATNVYEKVWVGQYQYTTPWMYPTGCFSFDNKNFTRIENNDVVSCKQRCGDSDIMLQIHKCLCVEKAPDIDARKSRSYCNVRCPGNPSEFCGGSDVYLHYTTLVDEQFTNDNLFGYNCGMRNIFGTTDVILPGKCHWRMHVICVPYDNGTSRPSIYLPMESRNFGAAAERCSQNGSYLIDPITANSINFRSYVNYSFWVDVRKRTKYVTGEELPTDARNWMCQFIPSFFIIWDIDNMNCSKKASYLCRKHKQAQSTMATTNGTTVDTGEPSTAIASEIPRSTVTNGSTPYVTTLESTRPKVKNGSSATVETLEMSKSSTINSQTTMATMNGTTVDTGEPSTAIASEITRSTVTNGSTPNVTTLENTPSKVKNGSSATVETSEMSKSSAINYMWIYFAGGAGLLIIAFIVVLVIVIILLMRIRRDMTKQTTESIPLDTRRHGHTDIVLTSNQNETSSRAMCSNRNRYESVESVRFNPHVPHCSGTDMFGPRRDGNKVLAKVHSCSDLTGSHHYSDVSNPRDVQAPHHDFDTQTRGRRLSQSGMARGDSSDSNGDGHFNNSHPTLSRNTRQTDDFNIHSFESSTDGWYQKLPKPGHKHRVQDTGSYDRCPGLSFDKGSKGNGNYS